MGGLLLKLAAGTLDFTQGWRSPNGGYGMASAFDHDDSAPIAASTSNGTDSPWAVASTHKAVSSRAAPWAPTASSHFHPGTSSRPNPSGGTPSGPNTWAVWIALATTTSHCRWAPARSMGSPMPPPLPGHPSPMVLLVQVVHHQQPDDQPHHDQDHQPGRDHPGRVHTDRPSRRAAHGPGSISLMPPQLVTGHVAFRSDVGTLARRTEHTDRTKRPTCEAIGRTGRTLRPTRLLQRLGSATPPRAESRGHGGAGCASGVRVPAAPARSCADTAGTSSSRARSARWSAACRSPRGPGPGSSAQRPRPPGAA